MIRQLLFELRNHLARNDHSEAAKALIERIDAERNYFIVTRLHRDDMIALGVNTSSVDDYHMIRLADRMSDDYCEQLFHLHIPVICKDMGIPFFQCPVCECDADRSDFDGNCCCGSCGYEWNLYKIPECFEGTHVLVEYPEDASHFEDDDIGYPAFASMDNGARYVSIEDYFAHFKTLPAKNTLYSMQTWPNSQKYFDLPESQLGLCEPVIADDKALEDFGGSSIWVPLCLLK